jgi:hypothetical protein
VRIEAGIKKSDGDAFAGELSVSSEPLNRRDHGKAIQGVGMIVCWFDIKHCD